MHLGQHEPQLLDSSRAARASVAHEARRFVIPFGEEKIDRVLQRRRNAVVVLRRDEDECVQRGDLRCPPLGVRLLIVAHRRRHRFVEQRKLEVLDVDNLVLGVSAFAICFALGYASLGIGLGKTVDLLRHRPAALPAELMKPLAAPDG